MISSTKAENLRASPRDFCISTECPWDEKAKEQREAVQPYVKAQLFAADTGTTWGPAPIPGKTCLDNEQLEDIAAFRQKCETDTVDLKVMTDAFHECENATCHKSFWQEPEFAVMAPLTALILGFIVGGAHK